MRKLFRSKQEKVQARAARMGRVILAAGAAAMEDPEVATLIASGALRQGLEEVEALPLDLAEDFLDMLEAGIPERFKHIK